MSDDVAAIQHKLRRASQLLLMQRQRSPGVKGWELRRALGKDYIKILDVLKTELNELGLELKVIHNNTAKKVDEIPENDLDKARFFAVVKGPLTHTELASSGWRIDDVAILAASIAYINSRRGKAPRTQVEELLREKFPRWKVDLNLDRFIRKGYLLEDEDMLFIGWRTRAEIDQKTLTTLILAAPSESPSDT